MRHRGKLNLSIAVIVPFLLCMIISMLRLDCADNKIIVFFDELNSNIFSTFLSVVLVMMYQYFSAENKKAREKSKLSRKYIRVTVISTVLYVIIAIVNACKYNCSTKIAMTLASISYIFIFIKYMKS